MFEEFVIKACGYALLGFIIYWMARIVLRIFRKEPKLFTRKAFRIGILFAYIIGLFSVTIFPKIDLYLDYQGKIHFDWAYLGIGTVNLIPFRTIGEYLWGYNSYFSPDEFTRISILNMVGNVAVFIPLGFLLPLIITNRSRWYHVLMCGCILSVFIEIVQLFIHRSTDIDDVIVNVIGTGIGYLIYVSLSFVTSILRKKHKMDI